MKKILLALTMMSILACGGDETPEQAAETEEASDVATRETSASTPTGPELTREEIEQQRFDENWRQSESFQARRRRGEARRGDYSDLAKRLKFMQRGDHVPGTEEIAPGEAGLDGRSLVIPVEGDISGKSVLTAQILLQHAGFSPGIIDGRWGKNSSNATWWFQDQYGLEPTGSVDEATFRKLVEVTGQISPLQKYNVTSADLSKELTDIPEDPYEKAELDCLCYESIGEALAEKFHTSEEFLGQLNDVNFSSLGAGEPIWVPNIPQSRSPEVAKVIISVGSNYLHGEDQQGNVTFHAPVTVGSEYDPSPSETLKVVAIAHDPTFHYQPKLFHEVPDHEEDVIMQPGPNSPVGVVWIALDKESYGIHGTAAPSTIGYASSHGCIRLTNWDATALAKSVSDGTIVAFTDTR